MVYVMDPKDENSVMSFVLNTILQKLRCIIVLTGFLYLLVSLKRKQFYKLH